jgi:hypothetical protein
MSTNKCQCCVLLSSTCKLYAAPVVHCVASREETGGFDTRPAPFEVKQRVDRRRDRAMKLEMEPGEEAADGDRCEHSVHYESRSVFGLYAIE